MRKKICVGKVYTFKEYKSSRRFKILKVSNTRVYFREDDGWETNIVLKDFNVYLTKAHDLRDKILQSCLLILPYCTVRILSFVLSDKPYLWWYAILDFIVLFLLIGIPTIAYLIVERNKWK